MRVLATLILMLSLIAMSIGSAGAAIQQPSCTVQFRTETLCYAADRPAPTAYPVKKPCACLVWLIDGPHGGLPAAPSADIMPAHAAAPVKGRGPVLPWRPPRA